MADSDISAPSEPETAGSALPLCTVNDLFWLLYLYPLRMLFTVLPRTCFEWLGKVAEPFVQWHERERRQRGIGAILAAYPEMTPDRAAQIARQCVANNMLHVLDDLLLLRPPDLKMLNCTGIEGAGHLERAVAAGKGVILMTGHFCANRIAVRHLAASGYPVLSVHNRRPSNRLEGRLGRSVLQPRHIQLQRQANPDVVYVQDAECSLKVVQRLRSGGLVNIQFDGVPGFRTVEWPFLGRQWRFPAGFFDIARLSGATVLPMLCLGRSTGFRIVFSPSMEVAQASLPDEFVDRNMPAFMEVLGRQIAEHPEEWRLWTHL
jgi:KDO2-lipid IV(A) lauroyltransferase